MSSAFGRWFKSMLLPTEWGVVTITVRMLLNESFGFKSSAQATKAVYVLWPSLTICCLLQRPMNFPEDDTKIDTTSAEFSKFEQSELNLSNFEIPLKGG